jgi:hypothetical protein
MVACSFKDTWGRCRIGVIKMRVEVNGPCPYNNSASDQACEGHSHRLMYFFANRTRKIYRDMNSDGKLHGQNKIR